MAAKRAGFTLAELMVALVIGALVVMALHQVLQFQSQSVRMQAAQIAVQQANRMAIGMLSGELREVDAAQGDLVIASTDSLRVRVMRKLGILCDSIGPIWHLWSLGENFVTGDSVAVFVENDTTTNADDRWDTRAVVVATGANCGGSALAGASLTQQAVTLVDAVVEADSISNVRVGAIMRSFTHLTYGLYQVGGEWVIGRRASGGSVDVLLGPLESSVNRGLAFSYYDTAGTKITPATAAQRASVRRIGITVRGLNDATASNYSDSLVTQVFLRNE